MQCIYRKKVNPVSPSSTVLRVRIHENAKHRQSTQQYICKLLRLPSGRGKGSGRGEAGRGTKLTLTFPLRASPPPPFPSLFWLLLRRLQGVHLSGYMMGVHQQTDKQNLETFVWGDDPFS